MVSLQVVLEISIPAITFFLMIVVGMDLTVDDFRRVYKAPRAFWVGTFGQYLLPLMAILTLQILKPGPEIVGGMILLASAPGGGISNYYSYLARVNVALSVVLTTASSLAAVATMPLLLQSFQSFLPDAIGFHVPLGLLFGRLLFLLLLPVLLGILIRRFYLSFVKKYDRFLRIAGFLALAALIAFILFQTRSHFLTEWKKIVISAALFIIFSLALGFLTGALFGLNRRDSFTILIEYGVRSVAIATTAAVVILKRTEFATFAAIYFLVEAALILSVIACFRRFLVARERQSGLTESVPSS